MAEQSRLRLTNGCASTESLWLRNATRSTMHLGGSVNAQENSGMSHPNANASCASWNRAALSWLQVQADPSVVLCCAEQLTDLSLTLQTRGSVLLRLIARRRLQDGHDHICCHDLPHSLLIKQRIVDKWAQSSMPAETRAHREHCERP